jgi:hypothetical protein
LVIKGYEHGKTGKIEGRIESAPGESMNAGDFLNEARATIQDRGMDYGHPTDNMSRTASLWSAYLEMPVTDYQVAMCLALVKIARSMETSKVDNYIDGAAYFAISGQLEFRENDLYV